MFDMKCEVWIWQTGSPQCPDFKLEPVDFVLRSIVPTIRNPNHPQTQPKNILGLTDLPLMVFCHIQTLLVLLFKEWSTHSHSLWNQIFSHLPPPPMTLLLKEGSEKIWIFKRPWVSAREGSENYYSKYTRKNGDIEDPKKRDTPLKFWERIDGGGLPAPCAAWTLPECSDASSKYETFFAQNCG